MTTPIQFGSLEVIQPGKESSSLLLVTGRLMVVKSTF